MTIKSMSNLNYQTLDISYLQSKPSTLSV
jgi:hypothetical protein